MMTCNKLQSSDMSRRRKTKLAFLVIWLFHTCWAQNTFAPKVIGGRYAELGEAPFIVLITDFNDEVQCAGTIIREDWILTASHCLTSQIKQVVAGFVDTNDLTGAQVREILYSIPHSTGDIALLKVNIPFIFDGDRVANADLPTPGYELDGFLEIFGWGDSAFRVDETKLKTASLPIIADDLCVKMFERSRVHLKTEQNFCAGSTNGGLGSCHGDSGGPLVKEENGTAILVGVVQGGSLKCAGKPTVFGRVTYYMDWIRTTIKMNESIGN